MSRIALITGGTRGIGFGIADALAREGFDLALCGRRPLEAVMQTLAALQAHGGHVAYWPADIADAEARQALVDAVREQYGALHVLVNNAGVAPLQRLDLLEADEADYDRVMAINLKGPYFLTQRVAQWMVDQQKAASDWDGCIVNITSISSTVASPSRGSYCLSKAGLSMVSKLWAVRLAEYDIPVYDVRPGITRTDMTEAVQAHYNARIAAGLTLQRRWGTPEDVGKAVAMLTRGDLPYATGQVLMIDGGLTIDRL